ncbi:protein-methionine-sulfoxide reductase heme-binding subunit MsrQ [Vibrio albus]|uniref:Protein-methionine-sulfoxide reductase heme-binding subunit MsrQ n=1 Tax=Vibrio albus TaxID=2200953 RepID=A0A2U3B968_9VIBR|nr:protein-methionine-sulfoxide reductase heme-binding subunit MsrQ [Vibrio albus]PWI33356.1 protein-methionine-sulfoxide reductase heme-binding subunit MsrQ [Vibrio albus]
MRMTRNQLIISKVFIHTANLFALVWLYFAVVNGYLGSDPVKTMQQFTGKGILHLLFLTLLITPIAKSFKWGFLYKFRRLLGLYSFFWAVLHLFTFMWLDLAWEFSLIAEEIISRPYLIVGMLAWTILLLLAITSTKKIQAKMGKHWQRLHNWVYVAVGAGAIHYYWSVKSGLLEPGIYLGITALLLALRYKKLRKLFQSTT